MSSRDRVKPSHAPTGEAALYKRAGGRAAFMTAEDGHVQTAPGVGTGWGGGIMLKQGNDPPPPVVCDQDDDGSGVAKQTLDPRRALDALQRQAAVKAKRTAAGGSDARGWSAPVPAAALAPRLAPNGTTAAPPAVNGAALPSFADHVRLDAAEVSHRAPPHAPVASTSSAHAPPAAPALRADLSRETRPDGVSRRDAAPAESPWSIYEPAMPSHTVEPAPNWAQGRSEFCAAQKFAPPDFHPRGYNDPPAPAQPAHQPVVARSWAEQGAAKRAAAKAAKAGSAGGSSASGVPTRPVANTTHTSKWATAAPAPAPTAALAGLPPGVQAAVASHNHAHAHAGSPPTLNGAAPAPNGAAPRAPAASTSASRYTNVSPVAPTPVRPPAVPPVPATATAKSSTAARPAAAPSASKYATSSSAPAASTSTPAPANAAPKSVPKPTPPQAQPAREAATATQEDKARAAPSAAGGTVRPKAADDRTVGELEQRLIDLSRRKGAAAAQRAEADARSPRREVWRARDEERARDRGARLASGGGRKEKKTPEELDALMEKMRVMNLDVRNKMEAAEQDRVAFEAEASARRTAEIDALVKAERERTAALDEMQREERAKKARTAEIQRQIDEERARSAARKLAHASGRAWDAGKLSSPSRGGSPPPAPAPAAYPSVEAAARDEARARAEREREPERALAEEEAERIRRRDGVRAEEGGWETVVHQEEAGRAQLVVHE
ncbi:hypothetical protein JCM10449v2_002619 [Rhodotorula kratochvilovae]